MEYKPAIDVDVEIPATDTNLAEQIDDYREGLYRISLSRKKTKRQSEHVGQIIYGVAKDFRSGQTPAETDDIVEHILRVAAHYCEHDRDPEDGGPVTFEVQCFISNTAGRAKRPKFQWTYDPITRDSSVLVTDPDDLHEDLRDKLIDKQHSYINMLHERNESMHREVVGMVKLVQAQIEPQAKILQLMGYGWIQGIQMQQQAAQAMAEMATQKEEQKQSAERWKIAGTVLQKALPVLADKGSAFALLQMAKKLGLEGNDLRAFMAKSSGEAPAQPALDVSQPDSSGEGGSFSFDAEKNPLATMARAFAAFIRPKQWRRINEILTADESATLESLLEAKDDAGVMSAYDRFTSIDAAKLADLYGLLDTDQAAELDRLAELISKIKAEGAPEPG